MAVLYHIDHPYYPTRNKGIDLFVTSILIIERSKIHVHCARRFLPCVGALSFLKSCKDSHRKEAFEGLFPY